MAKKGTRLREFEMNHRVLDISTEQKARKKKKEKTKAAREEAAASAKKTKSKKTPWVKFIGMAVVTVFLLMVAVSVKNIFDLKEEERALLQRNEELLQLKEELLMELNNVNSDEYIEEQARKELKLVKGNELIFFFPDDWEKKSAENKKDE